MKHDLRRRSLALLTCTAVAVAALRPCIIDAADPTPRSLHLGCPDPTIIEARDGSGYYIFATGRGIPIWHSTDLRQWKHVGHVFDRSLPEWAKEAVPEATLIWAPDISYFAGQYHVYYAVSSLGSQRSVIGLAVNRSLDPHKPDYHWEDRGQVLESSPVKTDFNAIDPALFVDRDGAPYLFWGSFWSGIKAARVDAATGKLSGERPEIVPVAARAPGVNPPAIEAPYVIFYDGYYYLFVSWDHCCDGFDSTYKVMVGRSKSVLGPYVDAQGRRMIDGHATLVLEGNGRWRGPGHNSVLQTSRGDWLVHHTYDAQHIDWGRVLQIRPLAWKDGWPMAGKPVGSGE